jgi:hypothetical protein
VHEAAERNRDDEHENGRHRDSVRAEVARREAVRPDRQFDLAHPQRCNPHDNITSHRATIRRAASSRRLLCARCGVPGGAPARMNRPRSFA